ncbi:MAG: NUDIX hydrolase [Armatimonadetes bacterium]|nr:NUDIX hydrolase [Armatimonadota bacterium]
MSQVGPETRLGGERVYEGRVVKLDVDQVRLADGTESCRELIRHPGATIIVPINAAGQVVLIRQWRYCVGGELLEAPAGTLDHVGEDTLACAQRELAEETGLAAREWTALGSFYTTPGFTTEVIWAFLARDLYPVEGFEQDFDEQIEVAPIAWAEAMAMARRGEIRDAKTLSALFLASAVVDKE